MLLSNCRAYVDRVIPQAGLDIMSESSIKFEVNRKEEPLSRAELSLKLKGVHGLLALLTLKVDSELMEQAGSQLKIIANYGVGYDNIDVDAATQRGIMVTNTPDVLTDATADFAWALLFAASRRIVEADLFTRSQKFDGWRPMLLLGGEVTGKTLGIVGAGRIGQAMAMKSRGFNMRVLYFSNKRNETLERELNAQKVDFSSLLAQSDFISLHVPMKADTRHLFNQAAFKKMKKSAFLINTARGPVVDEAALAQALRTGEIVGAGLDVFEREPQIHPELLTCENAILAPHIGSATVLTRTKMAVMAASNLIEAFKGNRPPNLVNPEVLNQ